MSVFSSHKRVAVLRGGPSEEFDVSMQTGAGVLAALADLNYDQEDIVITKGGEWLKNGLVKSPQDALAATDVVFIALHGAYGEDGTIQRLLEKLSIPYTGSTAHPSSIAMNKILTKEHLMNYGVKMAPHMRVTQDSKLNLSRIVHTISDLFGPEYVIKPISGGSSIGTRIAKSPTELINVIQATLEDYTDVLVEQRIHGREATCGVVENFRNETLYKLPSVEIIPPAQSDFFEADVKYTGETEEVCPGRFKREEKQEIENIAQTVHEALGLSQYSRSDFIVADDGIYFLEVNALPFLGTGSPFISALNSVGASEADFYSNLIENAQ